MPVVLDVHQPKFRSMREQRPLRRNLGSTLARHANLYNSFSTVTQRRHPDNHLTRNDDCYTQTVEAKIDAWVNVGLPRDIAWDGVHGAHRDPEGAQTINCAFYRLSRARVD
jgi:hypothetical protein